MILEQYLGIRWYMPTTLGEVVPKTDAITFGGINRSEEPSFVSREISLRESSRWNKENHLWLRRNRVGHSLVVSHAHNWWSVIPCDPSPKGWPSWIEPRQPYRDHPEYYALVNGHRRMSHYSAGASSVHGGEVCTTNPEVIRLFAEAAIDSSGKISG